MTSTKASAFISIHKGPINLTRAEFEAKANALGDAIAALPVARDNLLKLDMIFENTLMDKHLKGVGLPLAPPTVVMSAEYEIQLSKRSSLHLTTLASSKIRPPSQLTSSPRSNLDTCPVRPPHLSEDDFAKGMEGLMDDVVAQPVRNRFLSYSLWTQNDAVEEHIKELGYPAPEPLLVVRASTETLDHLKEIFEHSEVANLLLTRLGEFGFNADSENTVYSSVFSADILTKINNY
ncbi:hypothetical protein FB45DRAFT_914681 [Roridomyces roridus]|uniref:Uncharacterized protein n=1 Tax=Roridomyces roridus TaxID=1738132 RepID=A0AAD7BXS0_9AGAR|nr:hypothetical protein FB45DRAFT_914681 [Roridomyces roridus]